MTFTRVFLTTLKDFLVSFYRLSSTFQLFFEMFLRLSVVCQKGQKRKQMWEADDKSTASMPDPTFASRQPTSVPTAVSAASSDLTSP